MGQQETVHEESEGPTKAPVASWRRLAMDDIDGVQRVATEIHPDLPEKIEVFAERTKLFPEGCLALVDHESDELCGYAISHPVRRGQLPALNTLLLEPASFADTYYIHDIAILPKYRGLGHAQTGISRLLAVAQPYETTCLISVYGTSQFWSRFDFVEGEADEALKEKLLGYGDGAVYLERTNERSQ